MKKVYSFLKAVLKTHKIFVSLAVLVFVYYGRAFWGYFQGDEWFYFSEFLPLTSHPFGFFEALAKSLFDIQSISGGGHLAPVYNVAWYVHNALFGLWYVPYIFLSIGLHALNAYLLYRFANSLLKNERISFIAAVFFALNVVHSQAITWIMAYIPTQLSVTFMLLSLLSFMAYAEKRLPGIRRCIFFLVLALLTKESAVILFILLPLLAVFYKKNIHLRYTFRSIGFIALIYTVFRIGIPAVRSYIEQVATGVVPQREFPELSLMIFRLFTYPLKIIALVFTPAEIVLPVVEVLTPLAYPTYGAEKAVRGTNFLTFTQSAGSDMVLYMLSLIMLFGLFHLYRSNVVRKNAYVRRGLIVSVALILSSALPLLLIATYAPWWGYVTFIDSRHMYVTSLGAAIVFGIAVSSVSSLITRYAHKRTLRIQPHAVSFFLVLIWAVAQFIVFSIQYQPILAMGEQRKTILRKLEPFLRERKETYIVSIRSDTGYYGFGSIPPFQTNVGEVLKVHLYSNGLLPEAFMKDHSLGAGGIGGQGYKNIEGTGFGYFIDNQYLLKDVYVHNISPDQIRAFDWYGEENLLVDFTTKVQGEIKGKLAQLHSFEDWQTLTFNELGFLFQVPAEWSVTDVTDVQKAANKNIVAAVDISRVPGATTSVYLVKKPKELDFTLYAQESVANSNGDLLGAGMTYRNINRIYGLVTTSIYATRGDFPVYIIPHADNDKVVVVRTRDTLFRRDPKDGNETYHQELEQVLSTISFMGDMFYETIYNRQL